MMDTSGLNEIVWSPNNPYQVRASSGLVFEVGTSICKVSYVMARTENGTVLCSITLLFFM